jgi:quercetin dioxygenase-like cupin family protein
MANRRTKFPNERQESIAAGSGPPAIGYPDGVAWRPLVGPARGAAGLETAVATLAPGAAIPERVLEHDLALTLLEGSACLRIDGRTVGLEPLDCTLVYAGCRLEVVAEDKAVTIHCATATETRGPAPAAPPAPRRAAERQGYALAEGAEFHDLFAARFGARGICGGWARFQPGASLPCHFHDFDESITIVEGRAVCLVEGRRYELSGFDTALVPRGLRHRFLNLSAEPMSMIWVYAGDEPSRTVVEAGCCGPDAG